MNNLKFAGVLGIIVLFASSALADMTTKTRMIVGGQSAQGMGMDTMIYQKGARQRIEVNLPMGMSMITIYQCDQKRLVQMNSQCKTYMVTPLDEDSPALQTAKPGKGGVVTITSNSVDTGERQQMFGYAARHIKSTLTFEPGPGACDSNRMNMEMDGWYIDIASQLSCASGEKSFARMRPSNANCQDQYRFKTTGSAAPGFPLKVTMTMKQQSGAPVSMTQETLDLSSSTLDATMFDIPTGYREVKDMQELMCLPQGISQILKSQVPPAESERRVERPAQRPDALRIGVVPFQNKTGKSLNQNQLRDRLLDELSRMGADAVRLESETPAEVQAEARQKQCGFILYTDLAQLKEPSTKKKIGGLLGRAAGVGSGDTGSGEATVEFRLLPAAEPRQALLSSSATGKAVTGDESVASALQREAADVMAQLRKQK